MKKYLVGGAVRDRLLGLPVKERDWVVVGSTPEEMKAKGFQAVGRDFPVFLHPKSKEEHALARTERKSAPGHQGFVFHTGDGVSLEQDLQRRDLTVNAIAEDEHQNLIDPTGGLQDLRERRLRHVSDAFVEDPLRVLRVARFAAQLGTLGFKVDPATMDLMREVSKSGELLALSAERIWNELYNALCTEKPAAFLHVLRESGALAQLFPEIEALFGIPQNSEHHPEIDTGLHTLMVLERAVELSEEPLVRFGAICHDLGKALTPKEQLPEHPDHEVNGIQAIGSLCDRICAPRRYRKFAELACKEHLLFHQVCKMQNLAILELLERLDVLRRPEQIEMYLLVCEADSRGRKGYENKPVPQVEHLKKCALAMRSVRGRDLRNEGYKNPMQISRILRSRRLTAIEECRE